MEIKMLFDKYKNQYDDLKKLVQLQANKLSSTWKKGNAPDFILFEYEKYGNKPELIFKKEPLKKQYVTNCYTNVENGLLQYCQIYNATNINEEVFYLYDKNRHIQLRYWSYKKELRKISIINFIEGKQVMNTEYEEDEREQTYAESKIIYKDDEIFISETGFVFKRSINNKILLDNDYRIVLLDNSNVEIFVTNNNLANGIKKEVQVYPKKRR